MPGTRTLLAAAFGLAAWAAQGEQSAPGVRALALEMAPGYLLNAPPDLPVTARWDDQPGTDGWTQTTLDALATTAPDLAALMPRDIVEWCPAYATGPLAQRRAFWVGLISVLVHHESYYNPRDISGGGQWFGLMQIFPPTARHFGCDARSGDALLDPEANLVCAVQIMTQAVEADPSISVRDGRWRGVAAQWGPMTQTRKREDMQAWTTAQPYCQVPGDLRAPGDRVALIIPGLPLPALQ